MSGQHINLYRDIQTIYDDGSLDILLQDRTTGSEITAAGRSITSSSIMSDKSAVQPRCLKSREEQSERTRKHAEVYTPLWVCNKMIDSMYAESDWFTEDGGMKAGKDWREFVGLTWLEITCGEAPFIVQRYEPATGVETTSEERKGILDRKLRLIGAHHLEPAERLEMAYAALKATYGYELQGDALLIARINVYMTLRDWLDYYGLATRSNMQTAAEIISYNVWQMDGLRYIVPDTETLARIVDWDTGKMITFQSMTEPDERQLSFADLLSA